MAAEQTAEKRGSDDVNLVYSMRMNGDRTVSKKTFSPTQLVHSLFHLMSCGVKLNLIQTSFKSQLVVEIPGDGKGFEFIRIFCRNRKVIKFLQKDVLGSPLKPGESPTQAVIHALGLIEHEIGEEHPEFRNLATETLLLNLDRLVNWTRIVP